MKFPFLRETIFIYFFFYIAFFSDDFMLLWKLFKTVFRMRFLEKFLNFQPIYELLISKIDKFQNR